MAICEFVMKDRYELITKLIDDLHSKMLDELLFRLDQVMPSHTYTVGVDLALHSLNYLECTREKLFRNNYIGERRLSIIQNALNGIVDCQLTTVQIKDRIKNLPKRVVECHCESEVDYLETRIEYIKNNVKDLQQFELVRTRIEHFYNIDIASNKNKNKKK